MNRRNFVKIGSAGLAGLGMAENLLAETFSKFAGLPNQTLPSSWSINNDGTFNLHSGSISISNCYPLIDGIAIKPSATKIEKTAQGGIITYTTSSGTISIELLKSNASLSMNSSLNGYATAPHWFYPMGQGIISGANRTFKQGLGFGGPSGLFPLQTPPLKRESSQDNEQWLHESYLCSGFLSENHETLVIGTYNHKNYLQRSSVYNRQFRRGLINRHLEKNNIHFDLGYALEEVKGRNSITIPEIHFLNGNNPLETFKSFTQNIAQQYQITKLKEPRYMWCSWYEHESRYNIENLNDLIAGLKTVKPALPIQCIQIDDGYCTLGDWLINSDKFPQGLEHMFKTITNAGYQAGIWVGAFMVSGNSKLFKEHSDWMIKSLDGTIHVEWDKGEGPENKTYVLDTSHPDAMNYIRQVFRQFKKWGVSYYKTDFMDWGLKDSTLYKRHTPGKTSVEYFIDTMKTIREEIGQDSFWLACISPYTPFIGFADAMRISNDVWSFNKGSAGNLIEESTAGAYFNNILWMNDPDTLFLRHYNSEFNDAERMSLAIWDAMTCNMVITSDRFHVIKPEMLNLFRFIQPPKIHMQPEFPYWNKNSSYEVVVKRHTNEKSFAVMFLNYKGSEEPVNYKISDILGIDQAYFFDWEPRKSNALGLKNSIELNLKPNESKLFYVNIENVAPSVNLGLSGFEIKY